MIAERVEKTMKKALKKLTAEQSCSPNDIAIYIHTKPTEENPALSPKYFYTKNGKPIRSLVFTKDILGFKIDLMGTEALVSQFMQNYFKNTQESTNIPAKDSYIMIKAADENYENLNLALKDSKGALIKKLTLEEVFGE